LGRRTERLAHLSAVVAHVLGSPAEERPYTLEWLLEAANSIVTFRARYRRAPELLPVLQLVVFDETNPHAVAFQLRELDATLATITTELRVAHLGGPIAELGTSLRSIPLDGFEPEFGSILEGACANLAALLVRIEHVSLGMSDELQRLFFTHAGRASA
jgi:uncharacterized alpha-E superfamily protein